MIFLVVVTLAFLGGSVWLVLTQSVATNHRLRHRLILAALTACGVSAIAALTTTFMSL